MEALDKKLERKINRCIDDWKLWPFKLKARPGISYLVEASEEQKKIKTKRVACISDGDKKFALSLPLEQTFSREYLQTQQDIQTLPGSSKYFPAVYADNPEYTVSEWISGEHKKSLDQEHLKILLNNIAEYQSIDLSVLNWRHYSYSAALQSYVEKNKIASDSGDAKEAIALVEEFERCYGASRCLCHHDLNPENILWHLKQDQTPNCSFIDWEFAGLGIASFDLAAIVVEFNLDQEDVLSQQALVKGGIGASELALAIEVYRAICLFYRLSLESVW